MKRYDSYMDSGIEWIGEIPEGWEVKKLKYCFKFQTGFTPSTANSDYYTDGNNVWITIADLTDKVIYDSVQKITGSAVKHLGAEITPKGSLLYSFKLSVGKVSFAGVDCYTNEAIFSIFKTDEVNLNFFYYSLPTQIIMNANENIYGAKLLNQDLIKNVTILLPTATEQTAIATFLDRKTAEIDQLIANKEKLITLYEEEKTAIINRAVTRGLDSAVKTKPSGVDWLGDVPEHWEVKRLKYVTNEIITGKTPSSGNDAYFNGDINWFTPGDFDDHFILRDSKRTISESAVTDSGLKLFPPQTVLLVSIGATLGKIGITDGRGASNQQINAIVFDKSQVVPFFGLYYLHAVKDAIYRLANSATLPIFNQSQTKDFEMFVPILSEQLKIITHIETECARLDTIIEKFKKQIELFKEYRTTLISEVVTGKIDVRVEEGALGF